MSKRASKGSAILSRTANEVRHYRIYKRLVPILMSCIAILVALIYVVSVMYTKFGSFTVSVDKYHTLKYGLSLSETQSFSKATSRLDCKASEEITNIDGKTLDGIDLGAIDGVDSGENYLCYSFYCKNVGTEIFSYTYSIIIANMTMDIEKAIRVRLITNRNGENKVSTDYARAAGVDENGNSIAEPDTTAFLSKTTIMQSQVDNFAPEDMCKYTVVIWLEGTDPDCVDAIIGGQFKIDMKFQVLEETEL